MRVSMICLNRMGFPLGKVVVKSQSDNIDSVIKNNIHVITSMYPAAVKIKIKGNVHKIPKRRGF